MGELVPIEGGKLQTRSAVVPARRMGEILAAPETVSEYHMQFIGKWLLTYERLSVPPDRRLIRMDMAKAEMEAIAKAEIIPYANRVIERYPMLTQDILWEAWDLGVERYFIDNGSGAFPIFNLAALMLWLEKYRHMAAKAKALPRAEEPKAETVHAPRDMWPAFRDADEEALRWMLMFAGPTDMMFRHVASRLQKELPAVYSQLQARARASWIADVCRVTGMAEVAYEGKTTKEVSDMWLNRYGDVKDLPNFWVPWRREIIDLLKSDDQWLDL